MKIIPDELIAVFQQRDTLLGYISYIDLKGKEHKLYSMEGWGSKDIPRKTLKNELLEGYSFGEKAGDTNYGWDKRKAWIRINDPRGFAFEISLDNFLMILDYCGSEPGKKLKGRFIITFDDSNLLLLPESSAEYEQFLKHTEDMKQSSITSKNIQVGQVYKNKSGSQLLYLGKHPTYVIGCEYNGKFYRKYDQAVKQYRIDTGNHSSVKRGAIKENVQRLDGNHYWFSSKEGYFNHSKAFPKYLVSHVPGAENSFDLELIKDKLSKEGAFHSFKEQGWRPMSLEHFKEILENNERYSFFSRTLSEKSTSYRECRAKAIYVYFDSKLNQYVASRENEYYGYQYASQKYDIYRAFSSIEELYDYIQPEYYVIILDNDQMYSRWFYTSSSYCGPRTEERFS